MKGKDEVKGKNEVKGFNDLSKKSLLLSILSVFLIVSIFIYSCVNDDPDSGELSQKFLMGDMQVHLTKNFAGAPLKTAVVTQARKSKRLVGGAVIANNTTATATASGKQLMFFDPDQASAQATRHTMFLTSKNTNSLLLVLPPDKAIIEGAKSLLDGESDVIKNIKAGEFYGFVENDGMASIMANGTEKYFTNEIRPMIDENPSPQVKITPAIAIELIRMSLINRYETNQVYFGNANIKRLENADSDVFLEAQSDNLTAKKDGVINFARGTENVASSGVPMHRIVIDILDNDSGSFSCRHITEDSKTLFYAVKCEMDDDYIKKLKKLRQLGNNFIAKKYESAPELEKTIIQTYYDAIPDTSLWTISIPINTFVERMINYVPEKYDDDSSALVSFTSVEDFIKNILLASEFVQQPIVTDLVGVRAYIGEIVQQSIALNLLEKYYKENEMLEEMLAFGETYDPADLKSHKINHDHYNLQLPSGWTSEDASDYFLFANYRNQDGISLLGTINSAFCQPILTREYISDIFVDQELLGNDPASEEVLQEIVTRATNVLDRNEDFAKFCDESSLKIIKDSQSKIMREIAKSPPWQDFYSYEFFVKNSEDVKQNLQEVLDF